MTSDELFMRRALDLAKNGRGFVSPNPLVGCVIVHEGKIIGEGWHQKYGEAHAEVNAIESVRDKPLLRESSLYVNLEPCSHFGKTPPCTDLIIACQLKKVVIANTDSNPLVAGKGIQKLKEAGIEVGTNILEEEGRDLNGRFFTFIEKKRPYILLKWAQTADGFIARENYNSKWISSELSRQYVHRWRSEEDAVLVGTATASFDNPRLSVREWKGRNPVRIVLDRSLRLSQALHLFDGSQPTICYNTLKTEDLPVCSYVKVRSSHFLEDILEDLYERKIQSVMVEGGTAVLNLFIQAGVWDEARVFISTINFGAGILAPKISLPPVSQEEIAGDRFHLYEAEGLSVVSR